MDIGTRVIKLEQMTVGHYFETKCMCCPYQIVFWGCLQNPPLVCMLFLSCDNHDWCYMYFQFCTDCRQCVSNRLTGYVVPQSNGVNRHRLSSIAATATEHSAATQQVCSVLAYYTYHVSYARFYELGLSQESGTRTSSILSTPNLGMSIGITCPKLS